MVIQVYIAYYTADYRLKLFLLKLCLKYVHVYCVGTKVSYNNNTNYAF